MFRQDPKTIDDYQRQEWKQSICVDIILSPLSKQTYTQLSTGRTPLTSINTIAFLAHMLMGQLLYNHNSLYVQQIRPAEELYHPRHHLPRKSEAAAAHRRSPPSEARLHDRSHHEGCAALTIQSLPLAAGTRNRPELATFADLPCGRHQYGAGDGHPAFLHLSIAQLPKLASPLQDRQRLLRAGTHRNPPQLPAPTRPKPLRRLIRNKLV